MNNKCSDADNVSNTHGMTHGTESMTNKKLQLFIYLFPQNQIAVLVRRNGQQFRLHHQNLINGDTKLILRHRFEVGKIVA